MCFEVRKGEQRIPLSLDRLFKSVQRSNDKCQTPKSLNVNNKCEKRHLVGGQCFDRLN